MLKSAPEFGIRCAFGFFPPPYYVIDSSEGRDLSPWFHACCKKGCTHVTESGVGPRPRRVELTSSAPLFNKVKTDLDLKAWPKQGILKLLRNYSRSQTDRWECVHLYNYCTCQVIHIRLLKSRVSILLASIFTPSLIMAGFLTLFLLFCISTSRSLLSLSPTHTYKHTHFAEQPAVSQSDRACQPTVCWFCGPERCH